MTLILKLILFVFFLSGTICEEKKPLIYLVAPSAKGHLLPVIDAAKVLRERNYEILFISDEEAGPFLTKAKISHVLTHIPGNLSINVKTKSFSEHIQFILAFADFMGKMNFYLYRKTLEVIKQRRPDFIIYEIFAPFVGEVAREFEIPALLYIPGPLSTTIGPWLPLVYPPSVVNHLDLEPLEEMNFFLRMKFFLANLVLTPVFLFPMNWYFNSYRAELNLPLYTGSFVDWVYLNKRHPLVSPVAFPLDAPHHVIPMMHKIPPILSSLSANWSEVEPRIKTWIDSHNLCANERKLIYVSFGSVWSPRKSILIKLLRALIYLKHHYPHLHVLWARAQFALESNAFRLPEDLGVRFTEKYPTEISTLDDWMLREQFVSQKAILHLCRDDLVTYVTHCGASSTVEGLVNAIPLFGLPLDADQYFNAARIRKLELGDAVHIDENEEVEEEKLNDQSEEEEEENDNEILKRLKVFFDEKKWGKFRENERRVLRGLHLEGNSSGELLAAFVKKHIDNPILNDMKNFAPPDIDWPWWKVRSFDVLYVSLMIVLVIVVVIGLGVYWSVMLMKECLCGRKRKAEKKKVKAQ